MSRTVIVPLTDPWQDPERVAESALPLARAMASDPSVEVDLLSVIELPLDYSPRSGVLGIAFEKGLEQWVRDSEEYLERVKRTFMHERVLTIVTFGEAPLKILELARSSPDPLVIMGSHGRSGPRRMLMGSVAFRVVHDADCPVIVVHAPFPGAPDAVAPQPRRLLVPVDGSAASEHVIDVALRVLESRPLQLHLLRVIEPLLLLSVDLDGYLAALRLRAGVYLGELAERLQLPGVEVSYDVRQGAVDEEILAVASEFGADMIAMATHGRAGLSRLIFGSKAEQLTHEGHVPLLLVRPHDGHGRRGTHHA